MTEIQNKCTSIETQYQCYKYDLNGILIEKIVNLKEMIKNENLSKRCIMDCLKGKQKKSNGYYWFYTQEEGTRYFEKIENKECYMCNKNYKTSEKKFTQHKTVCNECFEPGNKICPYCNEDKDLKDFHFKKYDNSKCFYDKCWECCSSKNKKQQQIRLCENLKCKNFILTTCSINKTTGGREKKHCSKYCKKETHKGNKNVKLHRDINNIIHELLIRYHNRDKKKYKSLNLISHEDIQKKLIHQKEKCFYCKTDLIIDVGNESRFIPSRISLDRINNKEGYVNDNINICCELCNIGRGTMNVNLWIEIIKALQNKNEYSLDLVKYGFKTRTLQEGSFPWRPLYDDINIKTYKDFPECKQVYIELIIEQNFKCKITHFPLLFFTSYCIKEDHCCGSHFWGSIDRIDNDKNHTKDNIQVVCGFINRMRNSLTLDEFKNELIKRNLNNKNINFITPDNHNENFINNATNNINLSRNIVPKYQVFKIPNLEGKKIRNEEELKSFIEKNGKDFCGEFEEHKECSQQLKLRQREITRHLRYKRNGIKTFHLKGYIFESL
tara:strand:+ start:4941 stop:6599 length:1659 start_codon:yes stop_codon:yes gene_type:complete